MVVIAPTISAVAPTNCELLLESGRSIRYVATRNANPRQCISDELPLMRRKSSSSASTSSFSSCTSADNDCWDGWEGVNSICNTIDQIVEIDMESEFFDGKSVLEIGFVTGLPSVYAFENGADIIGLYGSDKTSVELYCKPTLKRNNIAENKTKISYGTIDEIRTFLAGNKFDIILAPDILNRPESEFEMIHDVINEALNPDGICLFSCLSYYTKVDGSLSSFLSLVKRRRELDALERWSSPKTDIIQRKVIQLTRSIF